MEYRKQDALDLVRSIAQKKSEETGIDYDKCISYAIDEACNQSGLSLNQYIQIIK